MLVIDIGRMQLHALPPVQSYRDLIAWQKSLELVLEIYRCADVFSKTETYGLVSQLNAPQFPYRAISRKVMSESLQVSSGSPWAVHSVL
ncbi:MAG: four helix bundle protein [Candidatus Sulfotelmatobacter sp.]